MGQARRRTDKATMEARKAKALELLALGNTYTEIAHELGYKSKSSAIDLIRSALKEHTALNAEEVNEIRRKDALKLEAIERSLLPSVVGKDLSTMSDKEKYPLLETVDRIVKLQERRAKLLGIDHTPDLNLTSSGQIQVILDGQVVEKKRSAVEVEVGEAE